MNLKSSWHQVFQMKCSTYTLHILPAPRSLCSFCWGKCNRQELYLPLSDKPHILLPMATIFSHWSHKFNKQVRKSFLRLKHLSVFLVFLYRMRLHSTQHFLPYPEYYSFATKHRLQLWFSATCRNYEVVNISDSKLRLEHQSRIFGASKWFQLWDPQS